MTANSFQLAVTADALGGEPRAVARRARVLGFAGLQFQARSRDISLVDLSASGRKEFLRILSSQDQQLASVRADLGPAGFGPRADIDQGLSRLDRIFEAAVELGSPVVCVDLGPLPAPPPENKPRPAIMPEQAGLILLPPSALKVSAPTLEREPAPVDPAFVGRVDDAMAELGRRADRYGARLAFSADLASIAALERAVKSANCPWFGVELDPVALLRDQWTMDEMFSRLGELIMHVRGRDAMAGADRRTRPTIVGGGSAPWSELLGNLRELGYRGWITIDPTDLPDRAAAAEIGQRRIAEAMQ